ncbi:uncharacterized protein NPIL_686641 [Nephila pilipes]|uniref:WASP family protein member n=1 Tax=Nephila pilipes TaxID=299642 RepID=A0A8X6MK42_NEPPI|nr:uncharacterized protein NPIL_686641 [Nephila pilipes]
MKVEYLRRMDNCVKFDIKVIGLKEAVSSLTGNRTACANIKSNHVSEATDTSIFCTFPRPPEVDRLRQLASGPSPPAFIPSHKVAPEADGEPREVSSSTPTTTHIYCQPLPVQNFYKSQSSSINTEKSNITRNGMTTIKVPSSIVPIDVSGQSFSRMANFRRSLIHVDFFIRRKKKKDKRRNTVTEGDTKELKDVLQNIINEECQRTVLPTFMSEGKHFKCEKDHNSKLHNENNKITGEEKNNNSSEGDASSILIKNFNTLDANSEEKNKINATKNENMKLDSKSQQTTEIMKPSTVSKRKPKSHIPISTVSAAMNVAVEMRQLNGKNKAEDQSSSGNWSYSSDINSSDSENKTNFNENNKYVINTEQNGIDTTVANGKSYRNSSNAMSMNSEEPNSSVIKEMKEMELSSCTSSDNNTVHDDATSNGTSTESDVFFISSDESDDSSDIIFKNNYGSSLSLSTVSDGSLNSLLSQTGTEVTSSTGTLTSIGLEQLPPPPPPPPPAIVAATAAENKITSASDQLDLFNKECKLQKQEKISRIPSSVKSSKEHKSTQKSSKSRKFSKAEKADSLKNSTDNSKNIFSTFINMKSKTREQNKLKSSQNKINKLANQPHFNVYGSSSPKNSKPLSLFLKENISPLKENEPINHLQSFSSNQPKPIQEIQSENKSKHVKSEFSISSNNNSPLHKTHTSAIISSDLDSNNVEVPLKYAHKVTVTPIHRQTVGERNNSIAACKKTLFKDGIYQQQITEANANYKLKPNVLSSADLSAGEVFYCEKSKPQYPTAVQSTKPKLAARVLLDPDGRVVQCTNSLDRRFYHAIPSEKYTNNTNINYPVKYPINREVITSEDRTNLPSRNHNQYSQAPTDRVNRFSNPLVMTNNRPNSIAVAYERQKSKDYETTRYPNFLITPPEQIHSEILHSQTPTRMNMTHTSCSESVYYRSPKEITATNTFQNTHSMLPPNPNISGLPSNEIMLTQRNINLHSKQMEKLDMSSFEGNSCRNTEENFYDSLQRSPQSLLNTEVKPQQSSMSTEDLFAVIHNCKKRMNIKTDSDISLTSSSSRSSSPSYLRPTSSKGALAETGFLSPRNSSSFDSSRDRRSWADFRPTNSIPAERKSLASDRLGPTKPTSMHDFKMLLLQTRSNSQGLGPRKSAVEMLKVPSSHDKTPKITSTPLCFSPCSSISYSVPSSPSSELYLYNGHSTVPFKRNTRARSSLQSRYTMYPPIFEDCSEDSENNREIQKICSETTASNNEQKNTHLQHNVVNSSSENTMQKTRHWL